MEFVLHFMWSEVDMKMYLIHPQLELQEFMDFYGFKIVEVCAYCFMKQID
jgi:hypothetical protein